MKDHSVPLIRCLRCGSSSFNADPSGVPICDYCGTAYAPADPRCPRCGAAYDPGDRRCLSCGAVLARDCPVCGTINPLEACQCVVCGQTLDATDALFARLSTRTTDQLQRLRETGAQIKAQEERASKARLAKMWAEEDRLRKEQVRARAERERQERVIITIAVGLVTVAVTVAVIIAILATRSNPHPLLPRSFAPLGPVLLTSRHIVPIMATDTRRSEAQGWLY